MSWMLLISVVQIDSSFLDEQQCFLPGIPQKFAVHLVSTKMHTRGMLPENSDINAITINIVMVASCGENCVIVSLLGHGPL